MEIKDIVCLFAFGFIMWRFLKKPDKNVEGTFFKYEIKIKEKKDEKQE